MKASRDQLKMIIKECLLEILSEGLGNVQALAHRPPAPGRSPIQGAIAEQSIARGRRPPRFDPRLDTPIGGGRGPANNAFKEAVRSAAGGNPMMADILTDTAMTTLPSMLSNGDPGAPMPGMNSAPGIVQQEQFNGAPEDVFGDAAKPRSDGSSHWSDLAFAGPSKKTA